jgi:hypothetical protein
VQTDHFNPVTRSLIQQLHDPSLTEFVAYWDALEALVIRVFRTGEAKPGDEAEYRHVRTFLSQSYPQWERALGAYWPLAKVAGGQARGDPFARLIATATVRKFVGDWTAMQALPAAREALNRFLMDLLGG